ncbi:MAG: hypothetical protein ACYDCH_06275 [Gaiellaceae bacterium]
MAVFRLRKPYEPAAFRATVKVLDGIAAKLAARSRAMLTGRATTTIDGRRSRAYRYSRTTELGFDSRIGFVLVGSREYELYCQDAAGRGDISGACSLLFESFSTT